MPTRPMGSIRPLGPADAEAAGAIFGACFADDPLYAGAIGFSPAQTSAFMTLVAELMLWDPRCAGFGAEEGGTLSTAALFAPPGWSPRAGGLLRSCWRMPAIGLGRAARVVKALADAERQAPEAPGFRHLVFLGGRVEARGRGLGEGLLGQALAEAVRTGARGCYLETVADNRGAIRFYDRMGFSVRRPIRLLEVPHVQMVRPL